MKQHAALLIVLLLAGCASKQPAPVSERSTVPGKQTESAKAATPAAKPATTEKDWRPDSYTVKKGDTLYSIGLEHGYDYKDIAQWNNIQPPYVISLGQQLRMKGPKAVPVQAATPESSEAVVTPLKVEPATAKPLDGPPLITDPKAGKQPYSEQAATTAPPKPAVKPAEPAKTDVPADKTPTPSGDDVVWVWPASGKVLAGFNDMTSAKGVDIAGTQGQPVLAAAPGKVIYSGAGVRGYGKLVIIKHNPTYLSVYAYNSQLLVKEGQEVAKGQKIAEMGSTDTDRVKLHFEIRKLGKPVDPAKYLPAAG